ncbi:hypothetical protein [Lysobacter fragariae]
MRHLDVPRRSGDGGWSDVPVAGNLLYRSALASLLMACMLGCTPAIRGGTGLVRNPPEKTVDAASDELSAFTGDDFDVRMWRSADLDGDGDADVIAVLSERGAAGSGGARTLLLLRRSPDGHLERVVENRDAILPESRGGMLGDPLRDLIADKNGFVLVFEGGSREMWSRRYSFDYVPSANTWMLREFNSSVLDRQEGTTEQKRFDARDFGEISISQFAPDSLPVEGF